ncbi:MAG: trigger factor [Myxococcota bacterium]
MTQATGTTMTTEPGQQPQQQSVRVTSTEAGPVAWSLDVAVDAKRVRKAFDRAYRDLGKRVNLKGFRPGKAPRPVLEKLYAASVAEQLERGLVAETLAEAIEQSGIEPVAEPAIEAQTPAADSDFHYTVRVEVKPVVVLPDTDGLPALEPEVDVGDDEVDERLEALRQRNAPVVEEPEGSVLENGHVATIDFVGRVDGEAFEGGSGRDVEVEIGAGHFIPGFEEQLVGAVAGDDLEVRVTFPEPYGNAELAGKQAVFACHVVAVKKRQVAELDDDFAKDVGDFDSLDALRQRIRDDLVAARERESKQVLRKTLMDALIERAVFEVPAGMVERQLDRRLESAHQRLQGQLPDDAIRPQLERWREQWRQDAERDVREGLLLEAIARAESIEVGDDEVEAKIAEIAAGQGVDAAVLESASGGDGLKRAVKAELSDEKALAFLVSKARVEAKTDT